MVHSKIGIPFFRTDPYNTPQFKRSNWERLRRTEFRIGVRRLSIVQRLTNRQF
jgi:hypothetical protein